MTFLKIFLLSLLFVFSSCSGQSKDPNNNWTTIGCNNQRAAYVDQMITTKKPEVKVKEPALYYPLVKDGILYYNDGSNKLAAFDIATQSELWNLPIDFHFTKLVISADDKIFLAGRNNITAIDLSLKEEIWKIQGEPESISSISVEDNILYSTGYKLRAFDTANGNIIWEFVPDHIGTGDAYFGQPTFYDDILFVGGNHVKFYAINKKNGKEIWSINQRITGYPLYTAGKIIISGFDFSLYALNPDNGAVVWQYQSEALATGLAGTKDVVYMSAFNDSSVYLNAFDANTGKIIWEHKYESAGISRLAVSKNGLVFCRSGDTSNVNLLNIENGNEIWRKDLASFITTSEIVLLNNAIIFIGQNLMEDTSAVYILK